MVAKNCWVMHLLLLSRPTALGGGNPQGSGIVHCREQLASRLLCSGVNLGNVLPPLNTFSSHGAVIEVVAPSPDSLLCCRLPIPFRSPMTYVIGKPIEVVQNSKATHAEVASILYILDAC